MGVDASLAAGEGGAALVHISTRAAVILQPEAGAAAALRAQEALTGDGAGVWASPGVDGLSPWRSGVRSPHGALVPTTLGGWLYLGSPALPREAGSTQVLSRWHQRAGPHPPNHHSGSPMTAMFPCPLGSARTSSSVTHGHHLTELIMLLSSAFSICFSSALVSAHVEEPLPAPLTSWPSEWPSTGLRPWTLPLFHLCLLSWGSDPDSWT